VVAGESKEVKAKEPIFDNIRWLWLAGIVLLLVFGLDYIQRAPLAEYIREWAKSSYSTLMAVVGFFINPKKLPWTTWEQKGREASLRERYSQEEITRVRDLGIDHEINDDDYQGGPDDDYRGGM
jgi:hypothetical protein